MINGWMFDLLILSYLVILLCALSFGAAANRGDDHSRPVSQFDELALRRARNLRAPHDRRVS